MSDFIDFLLVKQDPMQWELWICFKEALDLAELSLSDYLPNLEAYEERLARRRSGGDPVRHGFDCKSPRAM